MMGSCTQPNCFSPDTGCKLGNTDLSRCKFWNAEPPPDGTEVPDEAGEQRSGVPWTGLTLGRADLVDVSMRGRPILIGVIGPARSGKTTLLVGLYLMLMQGHRLAGCSFAGSLTLEAWESLAGWMRWIEIGRPPTFPPHTSSLSDRQPGLLHLALRTPSGARRDVLLTDAPGEWFTRWALKLDSPEAEGARWTAERCDAFLLLADRARLASPEFGTARRDLRLIMERLGACVGERPVGFIWAKSDIAVRDALAGAIKQTQEQCLSHAETHEVTIKRPESMVETASALLSSVLQPPIRSPLITPVLDHRPYWAFRPFT